MTKRILYRFLLGAAAVAIVSFNIDSALAKPMPRDVVRSVEAVGVSLGEPQQAGTSNRAAATTPAAKHEAPHNPVTMDEGPLCELRFDWCWWFSADLSGEECAIKYDICMMGLK